MADNKTMGQIEEEPLNINTYEISILVDNKPIHEYHHDGGVFVEGRNGSEYTIRLANRSYQRVCFVLSVDGLSVLDGKECSNNSPGYLLTAYQTLDISCYKVDAQTGAKFVFGSKDKSYSAEIGKGTDNVGVIAAMVFAEKMPPVIIQTFQTHCFGAPIPQANLRSMKSKVGGTAAGGWSQNSSSPSFGTNTASAASVGSSVEYSASIEPATMDSMPADEKLGTVFGESMAWKTQTVLFDREVMPAASLMIFYDTRKNLERRGVKLEHKVPPLPNPFPGNPTGCPTPDNWRK